ncbi:MAG: hypothetical protein RQ760_13405 [Sedimentisphaerales bacterium]|nr:hypothetical protein [Sedimentisphaerales bacterium]
MKQKPEASEKYKTLYRKITRTLALPSMVITCLIIFDIIAPASKFDKAVITRKNTYRTKSGINYNIQAKGKYDYHEKVNKQFYDTAKIGDDINVALSRFFGEWKSIELIRENKVIIKTTGLGIYYMGIFGLLFLVPLLAFLSKEKFLSNLLLIIFIPVLEFIAILLWIKLILVLADVIEKV